jgi:YidC/Oxa1 family membrane protein insertase
MITLFHTFVYDPLYNILIGLYDVIPGADFGISIIIITILLKIALIPLSKKQIESQKRLQEIQPKIKELQKKYKDDKEKQAREMMDLYKKEKVNPLGGCLPLIIQLIFFIAIYRILIDISTNDFLVNSEFLYSFVSNPETINTTFLGIVDLTVPNIFLAVVTAFAQYIQMKMMMKNKNNEKQVEKEKEKTVAKQEKQEKSTVNADFTEMMQKQMLYIFPFLTLFIGISFGAGLILYWLTSTLFMIGQQWYIMNQQKKS